MSVPAPPRRVPTPIQMACPVVLRDGRAGPEVLVLALPGRGTELIRGIVGPREAPEAAALRELREKSGLNGRRAAGGARCIEPVHGERWHLVPCAAPGAPDHWIHRVPGEDGGDLLRFRWLPLDGPHPPDMDAASRAAIAASARSGA